MILRNLIFEAKVVKQRLRAEMVSHHEQQASERGDEQQHPERWPAYSVNSPALQESTQGLFQQTQLFTSIIRFEPRWCLIEACGGRFLAPRSCCSPSVCGRK